MSGHVGDLRSRLRHPSHRRDGRLHCRLQIVLLRQSRLNLIVLIPHQVKVQLYLLEHTQHLGNLRLLGLIQILHLTLEVVCFLILLFERQVGSIDVC